MDGRATFAGVPPGSDCVAVARAPGWSVASGHTFGDGALPLEVSRGAALELHVTDSRGRPLAGATLTVRSSEGRPLAEVIEALTTAASLGPVPPVMPGTREVDPPPEGAAPEGEEAPPGEDPSAVALEVPASGVVVLDALVGGSFSVEVSAAGRVAASRELTVAAGARTVSAFVLERAAQLSVAVAGVEPQDLVVSVEQDGTRLASDDEPQGQAEPGVFHFSALRPGEAWIAVEARGSGAMHQKVALGEGEAKRVALSLNLGAVEVVTDGSLPAPRQGSPGAGRTVLVLCGDGQEAMLSTQHDRAELDAVQAGTRCVTWLPDAPQIAAELRAPGTVRLAAAPNALELVAKDGAEPLQLQLLPADGTPRIARAGGRGVARLANVAPGRYLLRGSLGQAPVDQAVDVQPSGVQRVVVSPVAMRCFTARVVDRESGERLEGRLAGYQKLGDGFQEVLTADWRLLEDGAVRQCFDAQKVSVLAVSAEGYAPVVLGAANPSLGTVAVAPTAVPELALAEAVHPDESGAMVVDLASGLLGATGLRSGDRLISIDGREVAQMVPEEVRGRLSPASGAALHLAVRGADGVRELNVTLP